MQIGLTAENRARAWRLDRSLPQRQREDADWRQDPYRDDQAEERGGDRPAEIQRPPGAVAGRHEQGWIRRVPVELAKHPVLGDVRLGFRPSEPGMSARADDAGEDDPEELEVEVGTPEPRPLAGPH